MTRASDLQELGISEGASRKEITTAYKTKARVVHPDKGGQKEDFQNLFDAYERLLTNNIERAAEGCANGSSNARTDDHADGSSRHAPEYNDSSDYSDDGCEPDDAYFNFFGFHYTYFGGFDDDAADMEFDNYMDGFETQSKAAFARRRRYKNVKAGYDKRDTKAKVAPSGKQQRKGKGNCMCCSVNYGITKRSADASGLNWMDYRNHPGGLRTCWACKNSHESVMTQKMALKRYSKVLTSAVFVSLRRERKCFRHKPVYYYSDTNESTYFWVADLELEAARGEDSCTSVPITMHGGCNGDSNAVSYSGDEWRVKYMRGTLQTKHLLQKNNVSIDDDDKCAHGHDVSKSNSSKQRRPQSHACTAGNLDIDPGTIFSSKRRKRNTFTQDEKHNAVCYPGDEGRVKAMTGKILASKRRKRNPFTQDEKQAILQGVQTFGQAWSRILRQHTKVLSSRTAVDIKDCYRNMMNANVHSENVSPSKGRLKNPFTQHEKNAIVGGVQKFGRAWRTILREYQSVLSSRTDVNIKDCYRNLSKKSMYDTDLGGI